MAEHSDIIFSLPEEDFEVAFSTLTEGQITDWGLMTQGIPDAHKLTQGEGIKIAVLDTGSSNHIDLNDNILSCHSVIQGTDSIDRKGHSTLISGIIAAINNNIGVIGIAPKAKLIQIKVVGDNGICGAQSIQDGVKLATTLGADIINMSIGATSEPPQSLHDAIKVAADQGIIIVAAAGNDGKEVNWPAKYNEVIACAALNQDGTMAKFSSRGEKIDFAAPGRGIYSTSLNNQYALFNGTSAAAPFISGCCALILSYLRAHPERGRVKNYIDMLKILDRFSNPTPGEINFIKHGQFGYGIPKFINIDWTK